MIRNIILNTIILYQINFPSQVAVCVTPFHRPISSAHFISKFRTNAQHGLHQSIDLGTIRACTDKTGA